MFEARNQQETMETFSKISKMSKCQSFL